METSLKSKEAWRRIKGCLGYEVSSWGNVKSVDRTVIYSDGRVVQFKGQRMILTLRRDGYMQIRLKTTSGWKNKLVHRLVAIAFIPNQENKPEVNHKDGSDRTNNYATNLEWVTTRENIIHANRNHLIKRRKGELHQDAKLTVELVRVAKDMLTRDKVHGRFVRVSEHIAKEYGIRVTGSAISAIHRGLSWAHVS